MNPPSQWIGLPTPDKVRLIERSLRCFTLGLLGLIPGFGVALAWQCLRLAREIRIESEGPAPPLAHAWILVVGIPYSLFFANFFSWMGASAMVVAFAALQAWAILSAHNLNKDRAAINPARNLVFLGIFLAYLGLFLSIVLGAFLLIKIADWFS